VAATTAQFRLRRRGPILLPLLNLWLHQAETAPVESDQDGSRVTEMKVTFSVERYWKGVDSQTIKIFTGAGCCDCGVKYSVGKRYFVLAQKIKKQLRTDICTSPKGLHEVKPYEKEFGRGIVPKRPK